MPRFPFEVFLQRLSFLCIAALLAGLAPAALAQTDPPARAGRLSFADGKVSFFADRDEGWQPALLNFPVTSENSIWTRGASRAEVRFGATAIRFNDDTVFDFVRLLDDSAEGYLQRGTIQIRTRAYASTEYRESISVDTADGRTTFESGGRYRLSAAADGAESRIAVFAGRARFESGDTRIAIDAGKQLVVRRVGNGLDFRFEIAMESGFDRWADARDQAWDQVHSRVVTETVVSPYMTGYEDLDSYGEWRDEAEYGRVWYPRVVVADWAPYRYGRWSYVRPWGWTWIDDASWGFAPFHYGRWVQVRNRWCWWPGAYAARPVYAPALVAWYGQPGIGITISSGPAVGWFPLGPRENYVPHYTNNTAYIRRLNHVSDSGPVRPPASYRNHLDGATIVQNNVFVTGGRVGPNVTRVNPRGIADHGTINQIGMQPVPRSRDRRNDTQMPDRVQGASQPKPQFAQPPMPAPVPGASPGNTPAPVYRPPRVKANPEPAAGGPLPVPLPQPSAPIKPLAQPSHTGAYPAPIPGAVPQPATASPPVVPQAPVEPRVPRQRQPNSAPTPVAPPPSVQPGNVPPAMPERDTRARQPRVPQPAAEPARTAPAPVTVPPPPRRSAEPVAPRAVVPAEPAAPKVKPPEAANKPRPEQNDRDGPARDGRNRPNVQQN